MFYHRFIRFLSHFIERQNHMSQQLDELNKAIADQNTQITALQIAVANIQKLGDLSAAISAVNANTATIAQVVASLPPANS